LEELSKLSRAFQRIEAAWVAFHPLVVGRNDHERVPEFLDLSFPRLEPLVATRALAAGDVADVDDEGEVLAVDLLDHRVERRRLGRAVGRVADQRELERGALSRGQGRRDVRRAGGAREQERRGEALHRRFTRDSSSSASRGESSSGLAAASASRRASDSAGGSGSALPAAKTSDWPPRVRLASSSICRYLSAFRTTALGRPASCA